MVNRSGIGKICLVTHQWLVLAMLSLQGFVTATPGRASTVTVPLVPVGHPGNAADSRTSLGAVPYGFSIGAYEITAGQFTTFLNAVARSDPYGLYDSNAGDMATRPTGPRIQRSGLSGSYSYSVAADYEDRPINFISWGDAARFCNWLHNGQPAGVQGPGTTERGSYTLDGATTNDRYLTITRSPSATYVLPTENEWYKAAYFDPSITAANKYWSFATRSNNTPSNQLLSPDPGNNANFYQDGQYTLKSYLRTDVGDFENSVGPWGTYDQMGNVGEWTDTIRSGAFAVRGESYSTGDSGGATIGYRFVRAVAPDDEETKNGFRVALLSTATIISVADGQTLTQTQAGYPLLSGDVEVQKVGGGTLVLTAANSYTGPTSVAAGVLLVTNSAAIGSTESIEVAAAATLDVRPLVDGLSIRSGQMLGGVGTVLGSVTFGQGSTLSPGLFGNATSGILTTNLEKPGTVDFVSVPEPTTLGLSGIGLGLLAVASLRRDRTQGGRLWPARWFAWRGFRKPRSTKALRSRSSTSMCPAVSSARRSWARVVIGALVLVWGIGSSGRAQPISDFSPVTDPITQYLASRPTIPGAGLLIADLEGDVIHEQYWGTYDRTTVVPIASASKWLSAGVIMSLVDQGTLDLDRPVGQTLSSFAGRPNGKADMTVRQMFSHTSGLPGQTQWESSSTVTLQEAATGIGQFALMRSTPGASFAYGGASMQVAGAVAEVIGSTGWADLFTTRIAGPLGMNATDYLGVGTAANPRIAGGIRSSVGDIAAYLRMIGNQGLFDGQRILSAEAVQVMLSDQTGGAPVASVPSGIDAYRGYGIGNWIERTSGSGQPVEFSSPGVFGTTPWINVEHGYYGVFLVDSSLSGFDDFVDDIRDFTAAQFAAEQVSLFVSSGTLTQRQIGYETLSGERPVVKTGGGTVILDGSNTHAGNTSIQQGSIEVAHAAALSTSTVSPLLGGTLSLTSNLRTTVGGLNLNAGGLVDIGTGSVTVAAGLSSPNLVSALLSGRAGGSWNGSSGINSSAAAASSGSRTVGWLDNENGSVTFGYAAAGDTNLDWTIDILDIANVLGSGKINAGVAATWAEGDFNYDGFADILDIADFISTGLFNTGSYNVSAGTIATVPEPGMMGGVGVGLGFLGLAALHRRRFA
jgi:autotransporter-associated beta strand protein